MILMAIEAVFLLEYAIIFYSNLLMFWVSTMLDNNDVELLLNSDTLQKR